MLIIVFIRFCGSVMPPALNSKSFEMTIFFTSDNATNADGFAAGYTTLNASTGKFLSQIM